MILPINVPNDGLTLMDILLASYVRHLMTIVLSTEVLIQILYLCML